MAERPPLPETEDPFELLGLTPPVSEVEIRRAYVRMSKKYRPEQAPEEFKRIRQAYEDALARRHWSIYAARPEPEPEPEPDRDPDPDHDHLDAEKALDLPIDELTALVRRPEQGWDALREQPERWAALEIFGFRLQTFLMDGDLDQALAEVSSPAVRKDVLSIPTLEQIVASVLTAAVWSEDRAAELFETLASGSDAVDDDLAIAFHEAQRLAPTWRRLEAEQPLPRGLRRFVELFPSVGHAHRKTLVADLAAELGDTRFDVIRALDRMHQADERLVTYLHHATEGLVYGEELAYSDLAEREREYVARAMERISTRLVARSGPSPWPRYALGGVGGGLAWLAIGGYTGLLIGTGVVIVVVIDQALKGLGAYMHATRDRIADAVVETGLSPDRMLEWLHRQQTGPEPVNLLGFDAGIGDDLALHTLARLARVCMRWRDE